MGSENSTSTPDGKHTLSLIIMIFFLYYCYYFLPDDCAHDATFIPSSRGASASGDATPLLC